VPDPAQNARDACPDACALCHADETRVWAVDAYAQMFGRSAARADTTRDHALPDDAVGLAEVARALAGGDPRSYRAMCVRSPPKTQRTPQSCATQRPDVTS